MIFVQNNTIFISKILLSIQNITLNSIINGSTKRSNIMNGGQVASRGFLYQGFASVLRALTDSNWDKIYVEFPTSNDKVDIALEKQGKVINSIQVKSTINTFNKSEISKWLNELINDINCPQYELFLIGQCSGNANIFMKSIMKYCNHNEEIDQETISSLEGFDIDLLNNRQICFSILPFDINILEIIVRDSLHQYVSYTKQIMTFKQISFIASATVTDQMISSTHGEGMDRKEFDEKLKERILLVANKYSPKRISIGIKSFDCKTEYLKEENCLNLIDKFDGRNIKNKNDWNENIYTSLKEFLNKKTSTKSTYQIFLDTHMSIAFATGRILHSRSGINIFPIQKTTTKGTMLWDVKSGLKESYSNWTTTYEQLQSEYCDVALILNVTRNIQQDVMTFIKNNNLPINRIVNCSLSENSATNFSIENGTHASLLANSIYDILPKEQRATLHIFASAPNAFMFFLGQISLGFGECILYEYDFERRNSCSYSPSMHFY